MARRDSYIYLGQADLFSQNTDNSIIDYLNEQEVSLKDERKHGIKQDVGRLNWSGRAPVEGALLPQHPIKVVDDDIENTHEDNGA